MKRESPGNFRSSRTDITGFTYHAWHDVVVCFAYLTDLRNFPSHIVRDGEAIKQSFLVKVIDGFESDFVRGCPVWAMEVPHIDLVRLQCLETVRQILTQMFWGMSPTALGSVWRGHCPASCGIVLDRSGRCRRGKKAKWRFAYLGVHD